ncbi:MAG: ABC transporter ATP-binding protein [Methanosarcina flavescens]|jgi:putative ABC transport system ATP-binding protein|uniref:ABC transporter ATP-binding protein n=1 Tax=Methanosarcina flavescens TaxID=1715806 RepID=A0A660HUL3_9EURY|nr:ABC transporter ATP-binding protein [Methanosarcina flavescens]AYK15963.1 ABC transporter ATP-binding protein [Methanosarcina flavescens]NLK33230.1 ABC transporter ATP-binding protein [Methanosarcina flavescens]
MDNTLIAFRNVWKTYQMGEVQVNALRAVSVKFRKGEFAAIIGPSGSGKSTMMNLVGCLDIPTKGEIFLKGRNIAWLEESELAALRGRTIGFVFQQYNLIPGMTALENVLLPLEIQEIDDRIAEKRAKKLLSLVGLSDKIQHKPSQLSGGQQQRVSIARALACNPEIILADEPTGALDSVTGRELLAMLYRLWKEEGKTIVMVTHDLHLAKYASRHIELKDGKIIRDGINEEKLNPETHFEEQ